MGYEHLQVEEADGLLVVRIHRPRVMNALSAAVLRELESVFCDFAGRRDLGAAVLTGGDTEKKPAFAAGADIEEMSAFSGYELRCHAEAGQRALAAIEGAGKPVIAAINGFALGGGLELALACHIRLASDNALMGQPEINLGIIPGFGGSQRLPRLIGKGQALKLLLTGDAIKAEVAKELGLVEEVHPADSLMDAACFLGRKLASKAPLARSLILDCVNRGLDMDLQQALRLEADLFGVVGGTEDVKEGLKAFVEKRTPEFKGR